MAIKSVLGQKACLCFAHLIRASAFTYLQFYGAERVGIIETHKHVLANSVGFLPIQSPLLEPLTETSAASLISHLILLIRQAMRLLVNSRVAKTVAGGRKARGTEGQWPAEGSREPGVEPSRARSPRPSLCAPFITHEPSRSPGQTILVLAEGQKVLSRQTRPHNACVIHFASSAHGDILSSPIIARRVSTVRYLERPHYYSVSLSLLFISYCA